MYYVVLEGCILWGDVYYVGVIRYVKVEVVWYGEGEYYGLEKE